MFHLSHETPRFSLLNEMIYWLKSVKAFPFFNLDVFFHPLK
ncbi:hypothetical protein HMPREF9087_2599 [Enterococcus casseliflavus ATCC 12755]|uniref:Uncharacterized protein n=1 Tax=Enterococcus casseliflavus ATCC 12755 TaxID=888066 RepID=F0EMX5_ENTCA|nr:hypothetical protein HMPREF9087_2599 [Enterococcus casseliflavus ATCC 12755]